MNKNEVNKMDNNTLDNIESISLDGIESLTDIIFKNEKRECKENIIRVINIVKRYIFKCKNQIHLRMYF